jgi:hypothetical protein
MSPARKTVRSAPVDGRIIPAMLRCVGAVGWLALGCAALSCGSEAPGKSTEAASADELADASADAYVGCATDPRVSVYGAGAAAESQDQSIRVVLVATDPVAPLVGMNTWTVRVEDASDAAVSDASLTVAPYMPDHGHGSPLVPVATSNGDGTYAIAPLYFFMPGVWRIGITVSPSDASPSSTVDFFFCVGG